MQAGGDVSMFTLTHIGSWGAGERRGCKSLHLNVPWLFYFPVKWLKPDFFFKAFPHGQVCVSLELKSRLMVLYFKSFHCDSFLAWAGIL